MEEKMTLVELNAVLGKLIRDLTDEREPWSNKQRIADVALVVSSLAKQTINNADVILRAEKLFADGKLKDSEIMKMVSGDYVILHKQNDGELVQKY